MRSHVFDYERKPGRTVSIVGCRLLIGKALVGNSPFVGDFCRAARAVRTGVFVDEIQVCASSGNLFNRWTSCPTQAMQEGGVQMNPDMGKTGVARVKQVAPILISPVLVMLLFGCGKTDTEPVTKSSSELASEPSEATRQHEPKPGIVKSNIGQGQSVAETERRQEGAVVEETLDEKLRATIARRLENTIERIGSTADATKGDPTVGPAVKKWKEALESKAGEEFDGAQFVFTLIRIDGLYDGNKFQPSALREYTRRTDQVPADFVLQWQEALETSSGSKPSRFQCLLSIVEMDRFFAQGSFDDKVRQELVARLHVLPKDAVEAIASAANMNKNVAAVFLVQLDDLFVAGKFQRQVFQKAIESATAKK